MPQSTRYWQASMPGVSCLRARFTDQHFVPHSHDALVIAVTESGGSSYKSRGISAEANADQLLVFNPTEPHAGHMRGSRLWCYRGLYLASPAIDALLDAVGRRRLPGFTSNGFADADLIGAFLRVHRELENGDEACARERLIDACGRLFAAHSSERGTSPQAADRTHVERALAVIRARFREPITVDDLATPLALSPFQLIRQFKRVTGMPPYAHVQRERLHHAIRRLRHGATLAEAAVDAGFYDQSALTRHFRRAYGITPGQYLRAVRGR